MTAEIGHVELQALQVQEPEEVFERDGIDDVLGTQVANYNPATRDAAERFQIESVMSARFDEHPDNLQAGAEDNPQKRFAEGRIAIIGAAKWLLREAMSRHGVISPDAIAVRWLDTKGNLSPAARPIKGFGEWLAYEPNINERFLLTTTAIQFEGRAGQESSRPQPVRGVIGFEYPDADGITRFMGVLTSVEQVVAPLEYTSLPEAHPLNAMD